MTLASPFRALSGATIFITGGAGFIGTAFASSVIEESRVVVYDNFSRDALSSSPIAMHKNLTVVRGDILDLTALRQAARGADYVLHCAAIAGIDTTIRSPVSTLRVNMVGSANLLEVASELPNLKRVLCFSTSEVFGSRAFRPTEDAPSSVGTVGEARWTYAVSKLAEEHLAIAYFKEHGLPATVVRPFNVYGPGQVGEGALRNFVQRAIRDEPIEIHGDGTQIRAWCYVEDMIQAMGLSLTEPRAVGESFNIGNQRAVTTIFGLASTVVRVLGSRSEIRFVHRDSADVELRIPSVAKARELLGFEAKVDLDEGIRKTAESFRASIL